MSTQFNGRGAGSGGYRGSGGGGAGGPTGPLAGHGPFTSPRAVAPYDSGATPRTTLPPHAARTVLKPVGGTSGALRSVPSTDVADQTTFDALTDLFLGDLLPGEGSEHRDRAVGRPDRAQALIDPDESVGDELRGERVPTLELLILGHLPSLASIWGTQHLRELAKDEEGPVVSVRWQGGFASVEYFGDAPAAVANAESLESALERAARESRRVVFRADEAEELRLAECDGLDAVTILTGADEAATIGAYRTIKSLAQRLGSDPDRVLSIRVVVFGTDAEQSREVGARLASTARSCLGRDVEWETAPARIGSGRPSVLAFNGRTEVRPDSMVRMVRSAGIAADDRRTPSEHGQDETERSIGRSRPAGAGREMSASPARRAEIGVLDSRETAPEVLTARALAAGRPGRDVGVSAIAEPKRAEPKRAEPAGTPVAGASVSALASEAATSDLGVRPALCAHVQGLASVPITCPYAQGVEFAVDAGGRLHVLGRLESGKADEAALRDLMVASEWAQAHAPLLRLAAPSLARTTPDGGPGVELDPSGEPVMHLFSGEPRKVRRLLETDVRVHLLTPVCVGGKGGWFCTPLN